MRACVFGILVILGATSVGATEPRRRARRENRAEARSGRLGLGTRMAASKLLIGPAPATWVKAAGGRSPRGLLWPVHNGILWRGYGSGRGGRHRALDIGAPEGTPIRAAADGIVAYADNTVRGYGNLIFIVHTNGWVTSYAHASKIRCRPGQRVERGDIIGEVGHTGIARGDHTHFEFRQNGHLADPIQLFAGGPPPIPNRLLVENGRFRYRVRDGDTLVEIGHRFHVSADRLRSLNDLREGRALRIGQALQVPRMVVRGHPRRARDPTPAIGGPDPRDPAVRNPDAPVVAPPEPEDDSLQEAMDPDGAGGAQNPHP